MKNNNGNVLFKVLIIVALITATLIGFYIYKMVNTSVETRKTNHKIALRTAERGLEEVLMNLGASQKITSDTVNGFANDCKYQVFVSLSDSNNVKITSTGYAGTEKRVIICSVTITKINGETKLETTDWEEE